MNNYDFVVSEVHKIMLIVISVVYDKRCFILLYSPEIMYTRDVSFEYRTWLIMSIIDFNLWSVKLLPPSVSFFVYLNPLTGRPTPSFRKELHSSSNQRDVATGRHLPCYRKKIQGQAHSKRQNLKWCGDGESFHSWIEAVINPRTYQK